VTPLPKEPSFESRAADWLSAGEAGARILRAALPLTAEPASLGHALGRVLAEDLEATATLPPWDNSAMDGYAVRAADVAAASSARPVPLTVAGRIHAGDPPIRALAAGTAVRIMTGAPLPPGADAVVRVEDTDREEGAPSRVLVTAAVEPGRHVRQAGEDVQAGARVLERGAVVTPGVTALAAALGRAWLSVHRRPVVAILTTGNELRGPDRYEDVVRGRGIPESNGPMLAAMVREARGEPALLGVVEDEASALRDRIVHAAIADALVTVGGASMGEADLVKRVLDDMGFEQDFWRVRIRPGSPFGFGWLERGGKRQPVFGLPGNPTSAFVTFELFVRPFVLALGGHREPVRRTVECIAGEELRGPPRLAAYLRVRARRSERDARPTVVPTGPQGSGLVRGLALADGLAVIPEGVQAIPAGRPVEVIPLRNPFGSIGEDEA